MQAMINTAWISLIHIHGQKLSGNNYGLYGKAHAPNNPRVVLVKAEFEIEQRSFGEPIQNHVCSNRKAIGLLLLLRKRCSHQVGD
jgi:hypothetical protein